MNDIVSKISGLKKPTKKDLTKAEALYSLNRTQGIFEYEGLPETIPQRILETYNQCNGFTIWTDKPDGKLRVFNAGLGGMIDEYYEPTIATISNPALNFSASLKIGEDCVLMRSDAHMCGLLPIISKYAHQLTEANVSLRNAIINARMIAFVKSGSYSGKIAAEKVFKDLEEGEFSVCGEGGYLDSITVSPMSATAGNSITALIEATEYLKASLYNDLGIQANNNLKREAIMSGEAALNNLSLLPLIDTMLNCRRMALKEINEKYGTSITVKLGSAWQALHDDVAEDIDHDNKTEPTNSEELNNDEPLT